MPRKEDIEKFKEVLNSLGGESEIMERRSQTIEDVRPPDDALPEGIRDLLDVGAAPGEPHEEPSAAPADESGLDFGLDLSSLDDLGAGPEAAQTPAEPESPQETGAQPSAEDAGLDFGSLFGEETATPPIEDLAPPEAEAQEAGTTGERPAGDLPADEFSLPESESASLQSDLSQMEVLPEDIGEPSVPSAEEEPEAPSSEEALAGIELPNLEDLSLPEPMAGAGEEELPPGPLTEEGLPGEEPAVPSIPGAFPPFEAAPDAALGESSESALPPLDAVLEAPLEAPSEAALETSFEPGGEPASAEQSSEAGAEGGLANLNLEDFNFAEPTGQFAVEEQPAEAAPPRPPAQPPGRPGAEPSETPEEAAALPELGGAEPELSLTQDQFNRLKKTLEALPRNLKMAVQEVIGEGKASGANLTRLVSLLVAGATAQQIAAVVTRITGKRIAIPAGYEKKTGAAFEAEQRSFAYALRENIYPLVRLFALTVLAAALIGFLGYRLVYRPLSAAVNYRIGYTHILGDRFTLANESFDKARGLQRIKRWYYRYAEAFADKRQYPLAEQKYDLLLQDFPGDRKGILDYARMESTKLVDYKKADTLLKLLLDKDQYDFDALLAAGDNNLDWATAEMDQKDSARFKAARLDYATLIDRYGSRDDLLFRMLRWFIRTDDAQEIERLRVYFASRPDVRVNPDVYAELGGYLIDHRRLDFAKDVLLKADQADPRLAEIHYNLARYYRLTEQPDDELTALKAALLRLRPTDTLNPKRIAMEVDTHTRLGELDDEKGQYIDAEKELTTAIAKVEENQANKLITTGSIFGRPYADLGDLNYYIVGDLDVARTLYQKAIDNEYFDPSLDYKIGFTHYAGKDYASALASFSKAEEEWGYPRDQDAPPPLVPSGTAPVDYSGKAPATLLYAIGNCFYQRGDYFAAQGYYLRLRDRLEAHRAALGTLVPGEKPEQLSLLETLIKVNNNLGVTLDKLASRTGDRNKRSEGLVYLTDASQIADSLTRTPGTPPPAVGARNLPYLNQRGILYPVSGFVPQIESDIPKDLGTLSW
ncbi:MAG: periplasmic flagellar collar protein FlcA [Spirochaetia bacterium]